MKKTEAAPSTIPFLAYCWEFQNNVVSIRSPIGVHTPALVHKHRPKEDQFTSSSSRQCPALATRRFIQSKDCVFPFPLVFDSEVESRKPRINNIPLTFFAQRRYFNSRPGQNDPHLETESPFVSASSAASASKQDDQEELLVEQQQPYLSPIRRNIKVPVPQYGQDADKAARSLQNARKERARAKTAANVRRALYGNLIICTAKFGAWLSSGSSSMMSEFVYVFDHQKQRKRKERMGCLIAFCLAMHLSIEVVEVYTSMSLASPFLSVHCIM
jgi:hypothetical protein